MKKTPKFSPKKFVSIQAAFSSWETFHCRTREAHGIYISASWLTVAGPRAGTRVLGWSSASGGGAGHSYKYTQGCLRPTPPPGSTVASAQKRRQVWPKLHGQITLSPQLAQGEVPYSARVGHIPATAQGCCQCSTWPWGTRSPGTNSPRTNSSCAWSRQRQNGSRGSGWVSWSDGDNHPETSAPAVVVEHGTRLAAVMFCEGPSYI